MSKKTLQDLLDSLVSPKSTVDNTVVTSVVTNSTPDQNADDEDSTELSDLDLDEYGQPIPPKLPPLEEAINRAIFSLGEIALYATYGRSQECEREARETIEALNTLKVQWGNENTLTTQEETNNV
jgi:hypothetical protein